MKTLLLTAAAALAITGAALAAAPAGYHVGGHVAISDGGWDLASFDPVMRRIYLAHGDAVTTLDVDSGAVNNKLSAAHRSHAVLAMPGGKQVMVTDGGDNDARFIDASTGADIATVKVGQNPDASAFEPSTGLAVVMNAKSGDLTLIDPASHTVKGSVMIGGSLELAAADGKGKLFINVEDKNELVVVDARARKVLARVALPGCDGPTGIALLPRSGKLMSSCANGVAVLTDARTYKVTGSLPIGQGPDTVMYDHVRHVALVPCGRSGELVVFSDEAAGVKQLARIATQRGARTGAVDEKTGKVYLPTAEYNPPAKEGARPTLKPGSVTLLVVEP